VSVPPVVPAEDEGRPGDPVSAGAPSLEPLVARLSAQYGVDARVVRSRADALLASFAGARVQAFVPLLVEKRLHEEFRAGAIQATHDGSGSWGTTATGARRG
jgi:hypothetical protein